jgi:hypothetical protein
VRRGAIEREQAIERRTDELYAEELAAARQRARERACAEIDPQAAAQPAAQPKPTKRVRPATPHQGGDQ